MLSHGLFARDDAESVLRQYPRAGAQHQYLWHGDASRCHGHLARRTGMGVRSESGQINKLREQPPPAAAGSGARPLPGQRIRHRGCRSTMWSDLGGADLNHVVPIPPKG